MTISTRDGLVAALAAGPDVPFSKASITAVAGFFYSLFRAAAGMPAASTLATPTTTGRALDRTSSGALNLPGPSGVTYLAGVTAAGTVAGSLCLHDRLVEYGGLSGTVTTAQSLSAVTLPTRAGSGVGVELWLEIYSALGATPSPTVTASYMNSAGVSGRTATLIGGIPASIPANRAMRFALQDGDVGVRSVQSAWSTTSTGTAGNFGVTLRRPIEMVPLAANVTTKFGYAETALQQIPDSACLELSVLAATTSTGNVQGKINIAQG